jgi:hypothetical protein
MCLCGSERCRAAPPIDAQGAIVEDVVERAGVRVLIAHDLRLNRDALGEALELLRPAADVLVVAPAELDDAIAACAPDLIICSALSDSARHAANWILLHPEDAEHCVLSVNGRVTTTERLDLQGILCALDEIVRTG